MGVLTTAERNNLKDSDFALPGRRFPIHDQPHAEDALARVSENGTSKEKAMVRAKVKARYPSMAVGK